jgi:prolyl-tRNA synthetase
MRSTKLFGKTLRDAPADADAVSHKLLVRAGFIQQVAAGIFSFQPLGWRSIKKIKRIMEEELDAEGAQEINMPVVQPRDLWERSGRADTYVPPLATFHDRRDRDMVLAPTHEETTTIMAAGGMSSYRDLPFTLYHIQTKFRDEPRPRSGLLRVREFEMKDAYSFDADKTGLDKSFDAMVRAYNKIFSRAGLNVVMVEADSGPIGGKDSNEFVLLAESGEDTVLMCDNESCKYAANVEKAEFRKVANPPEALAAMEEFPTPGLKTIDALAKSEGVPASKTAKAVFYYAAGEVILIAIRGDYVVNETKLRNVLGGVDARLATPEEVKAAGLVAGSASPVGLDGMFRVIADNSLEMGANLLAGANKPDTHIRNVNFPRDFKASVVADIAEAHEGYGCPRCDTGTLVARRGVEVGHVFKLGTIYSEKLGAVFADESGETRPALMGCYGIGVGRLLAAAVEANHDDNGMVLPKAIAPYEVYFAGLNLEDEDIRQKAETLYADMQAAGIDVLFDDRDAPPGIKFKDADLIGLPLRVVISKRSLDKGGVEVKLRNSKEFQSVPVAGALAEVKRLLAGL